jgi:hypothetical protein
MFKIHVSCWLVVIGFLPLGDSWLAQAADSGPTASFNDPIVEGKRYSDWLLEIPEWRRNPTNHAAMEKAIRSADKQAHSFLKASLSKSGYARATPASPDAVEDSRVKAMFAAKILGPQGAWLSDDLLQIIRERGWKGREYAIYALTYVSPNNSNAFSIAKEDLRSEVVDSRWQGGDANQRHARVARDYQSSHFSGG